MQFSAMRTYAALRFRDQNNTVVTDADWKTYINDAYEDMQTRCPWFPWNNKSSVVQIAGNSTTDPTLIVRSATLPTDVWQVTAVWDQDNQFPLVQLEGRQNVYNEYPQQIEIGQAMHYRIFGNALEVYPAPASTTNYRLEYIQRPADLSLDADVPVFPAQYHTTIVGGAVALAYQDDGNLQMAAAFQANYEAEVAKLVNDLNQPQGDRYYEPVDTFL